MDNFSCFVIVGGLSLVLIVYGRRFHNIQIDLESLWLSLRIKAK
jgi:hypothetical protein